MRPKPPIEGQADATLAQALFEQSSEPQWMCAVGTDTTMFNRSWVERIGARPHDWLAAVHPLDRADTQASWSEAEAQAQPLLTQARLRLRDGSVRWHRISIAPLRSTADNALCGWGGSCIDIDDGKRIATTLRAEQAGIAAYLGELNHDLRNRIAALSMSVQVLQHDDASPDMRARAQVAVQRQAFSIAEQMDPLLASFQSINPEEVMPERIDIGDVLQDTCARLQPAAAERQIELACETPLPPLHGEADAGGLRTALENLMLHALDHSVGAKLVVQAMPGRHAREIRFRVVRRTERPTAMPPFRAPWRNHLALHVASRFAEGNGGCVIVRDDGHEDDATFDLLIGFPLASA